MGRREEDGREKGVRKRKIRRKEGGERKDELYEY